MMRGLPFEWRAEKTRGLFALLLCCEGKDISKEDYGRFIEQAGKSPPDFCVIRLSRDEIPGLKAAMVRRMPQQANLI
ncbi:hypothetical protein [Candidatus Formimonas warabiya]|uniref:Uncharacterized protein n=1 Tax=Formimonas warabiya TaxID=1761012 RepID=A0A3G1KRD5_FORW1|nr:hypothetical protein [Candidatus Formimonas warabiya]ATW25033.1 hypothetical protein DCMF_09820 [Candidatus Formimonas warabiya]